ncbi:aromatic acid exporter family protein [Bacillus oleivorans]|nr:aromatic acid exporter family protein [Bacillus oleivorans]
MKLVIGGRIMKTGIAVFLTALICQLLHWPAMFAVITAIVTIEPTAADSIKKAFVRFPASAIGAGYAALFGYLMNDRPITYAIVTLLTIFTCTKLRLDAGTLVATLTGIAMIPTIHDHYVSSFFIRLGTTSIGLIVSSLVNVFVMPPQYIESISARLHELFRNTGILLEKRGQELINLQELHHETNKLFQDIQGNIEKTETMFTFQKKEWMFHRTTREKLHEYHQEMKKFNILKQIVNRFENLIHLPSTNVHLTKKEYELLNHMFQSLKEIIHHQQFHVDDRLHHVMNELFTYFRKEPLSMKNLVHGKDLILFELLSIGFLLGEIKNN